MIHASACFYARLWNVALRVNIIQHGDNFSDDGSRFRCSWERGRQRPDRKRGQERRDGCKNRSVWRVDPTFVRPNHLLQFPCLNLSWPCKLFAVLSCYIPENLLVCDCHKRKLGIAITSLPSVGTADSLQALD